MNSALRTRQRLGKYRIDRRLADGGFATVYQATDTVEGLRVALKVPHPALVNREMLDDFRQEVRLTARLEHPHILPLKNADFIDGHFVVAFPLGDCSLADRLTHRMSHRVALELTGQMLEGVAYAHSMNVIHCDIKPENLILFPENHLCLSDFGIAKVAQKTVLASGSGTIGYAAPEQAMGKPSFHSDVFSLGLIIYRMFSGRLPEWPFDWPPPGYDRLQRRVHPKLIDMARRAIDINPRHRYRDAEQMFSAFRRLRPRALSYSTAGRSRGKNGTAKRDWREVRTRQFLQQFGKVLETKFHCGHCRGPVSEVMPNCPWCGKQRRKHKGDTRFPAHCPRCCRGLKLDWKYCPWCYGGGFETANSRKYSDVRYQARCTNGRCSRKLLMAYMRYCPWCNRKVVKKWTVPGTKKKCASCGWGILATYWSYCPWCGDPH